jgi:hypothetical protein
MDNQLKSKLDRYNQMRKHGLYVPCDYFRELKRSAKRKKARAFMEYYDDADLGEFNSVRFYAKSWDVGIGTAHGWIDDFKTEIDRYYASRQLLNTEHYTSVRNKTEQHEQKEMNTKNVNEAQNIEDMNNTTEQNEHEELNKGYNASIYNINADSKESPNKKSKTEYSESFLRAWNEYDKRNSDGKRVGNKIRSYSIWKRRFKHTDVKLIIEAIKEYKASLEEWRDIKDFDGFLNGMIDIYLPQRSWVITKSKEKVFGHYYESKDVFVFDGGGERPITKEKMEELLQENKIGFVAA